MDRQIKIRITKDGKVEIDSSIFTDCRDVANQFKNLLGNIERLDAKEEQESDTEEILKIDK